MNQLDILRGLNKIRNLTGSGKRETSRDRRLNYFFSVKSTGRRNNYIRMENNPKDSDIERGVPGQFDDAPEPVLPLLKKKNRSPFSDRSSRFGNENSEETATSSSESKIAPPLTFSFIFAFPSSSESSSSSSENLDSGCLSPPVVSGPKRIPPARRIFPIVGGQFDDRELENVDAGREPDLPNESPIPLPDYPYYLVLRKMYARFIQTTPLIPYPQLESLNITSDGHLFLTCNRLCSSSYAKGFFWCIRNPLEGIKGCRVELPDSPRNRRRSDGLASWKLNSPTVDTTGNNLAAAMYDSPITAAKPMSNRMIFFGDDTGKVGLAWYYFLDELDKYSYKLNDCRMEMCKYLKTGLFDVLWTDNSWIKNHNSRITAVDVCPRDGRTVASGSANGSVFTWNPDVFRVKNRFPNIASGGGGITSLSFSPYSNDCFVTSSKNGTLLIWDTRQNTPFQVDHVMRNKYLTTLRWNPQCHNYIVGGTSTGEILTFDVRQPSAWNLLNSQFDTEISHIAIHPTKPCFAASSKAEVKHFHGLESNRTCLTTHHGSMRNSVSGITFHKEYVLSIDNNCFLTAIKL